MDSDKKRSDLLRDCRFEYALLDEMIPMMQRQWQRSIETRKANETWRQCDWDQNRLTLKTKVQVMSSKVKGLSAVLDEIDRLESEEEKRQKSETALIEKQWKAMMATLAERNGNLRATIEELECLDEKSARRRQEEAARSAREQEMARKPSRSCVRLPKSYVARLKRQDGQRKRTDVLKRRLLGEQKNSVVLAGRGNGRKRRNVNGERSSGDGKKGRSNFSRKNSVVERKSKRSESGKRKSGERNWPPYRRKGELALRRCEERCAWARYQAVWAALADPLSFNSIPWPLVNPPATLEDISAQGIREFLFTPAHSEGQEKRTRIKKAHLRWHPDRFVRLLTRVAPQDKASVEQGILVVSRSLNDFLAER